MRHPYIGTYQIYFMTIIFNLCTCLGIVALGFHWKKNRCISFKTVPRFELVRNPNDSRTFVQYFRRLLLKYPYLNDMRTVLAFFDRCLGSGSFWPVSYRPNTYIVLDTQYECLAKLLYMRSLHQKKNVTTSNILYNDKMFLFPFTKKNWNNVCKNKIPHGNGKRAVLCLIVPNTDPRVEADLKKHDVSSRIGYGVLEGQDVVSCNYEYIYPSNKKSNNMCHTKNVASIKLAIRLNHGGVVHSLKISSHWEERTRINIEAFISCAHPIHIYDGVFYSLGIWRCYCM